MKTKTAVLNGKPDAGNPHVRFAVKSIVVGMLCLASAASFGKNIYVALGGSDEGAGTEAEPYASIEKAVTSADAGDVVVVGEGKFPLADTLYLNQAIVIRGAGSGKTTLQHKTTQDSRAVVLECADAAIEDCTITGGYLSMERGKNTDAYATNLGGAGVLIKAAGGRLSRCRITANKSNGNWNTSGGMVCVSSKAVVEHCTIDNNTTGGSAGTYAGVYVTAGTFDHCLIYANSGHSAGGVYVAGAATFSYCTIARNSGFGICLAASEAKFLNCVIAGNLSSSMAEGAPEYTGSSRADFTGTAFPEDVVLKPAVITGAPLSCAVIFNDAANYDFTQRLASQAKDCGCYAPYDYSVFSCDCTVSVEGLFVGEPVTLIPYVTGHDVGDTLAYTWTVTCPDGTKKTLTEESPDFEPEQKGWHDVSLSVDRGKDEPATYDLPHAFVATPRELTVTTGAELMTELGDAIDGQTIYLAASDQPYEITKALDISKDVKVIGPGWDRCTIKQKTNGQRVINLNNKDALVEGVTVTGGKNNSERLHGVGVNIAGYGGTLRNCRVIGNTVTLNHTYGIGVALQSADALVDHCIISNNTRTGGSNGNYGGGIYASAGTVTDCLVVNNGSAQHGGGIYAAGGVTVRNCTFAKNSAYANGGGVYLGSTSAKFYNCIFAENTSSASDTTTGKPEWSAGSAATMDRCSFPTAVATNSMTGGKCLLVDPVFVGSDAGDFHILSSSPTKDAGTDAYGLSELDLDGFTRVSGKGVDIGCYEFDSDQFSASFSGPATGDGLIHSNAVYTAEVSGLEEGTEVAYAWTVTSPSGKVAYPTGNPLTLTPDEFGNWHVSMVATAGGLTSEPFESDYYAAPEVIYVKPATAETIAAAEWPYGDPDHAATNVLDAVDAARDGTRIELDEGEFTVNKRINVTKRIDLVGKGWEKTIIRQKAKTVSVLYVNSEKAKVRQVTLTGMFSQGEINSRGAVMIETQGGTIEDCRITGNRYDPSLGINHARGVGITLAGAKAICRRCIIDRNYGSLGGNGDRGGGVQGLAGLLENCLVCCNTNSGAGGIYIECGGDKNKPGFTVRNCTVCGNVANGADSTGLYGNYGTGGLVASGYAYIANTIFFANESPVQTWTNGGYPEWRDLGANVKIVNCLMGEDIPLPSMAVGSITNNPCFVDAASDDYHLQKGSPCVNGGVNDGAYTAESLDLDRNLRVFNFGRRSGKPDLGCYETPWGMPGMLLLVH